MEPAWHESREDHGLPRKAQPLYFVSIRRTLGSMARKEWNGLKRALCHTALSKKKLEGDGHGKSRYRDENRNSQIPSLDQSPEKGEHALRPAGGR